MNLVLLLVPWLIAIQRRLQNHGVIIHATINEQRRLQYLHIAMDLVLLFMPQWIHGIYYSSRSVNGARLLPDF